MLYSLSSWQTFLFSPSGKKALSPLYPSGHAEKRYLGAATAFFERFRHDACALLSAPGRTELSGNHTDHQHGHVLAAAVEMDMLAAVRPTDTRVIRVYSEGYGLVTVDLAALSPVESEKNTTAALIRGVAAGFAGGGYCIGGFDAFVTSCVPEGSGLSSSAAFEVLICTALNALYNRFSISPERIARISQYAENVFFGKPCGLMDQMASAVGGVNGIDFLDPARPVITHIPVSFDSWGHRFYIVNAGGSHANLTDAYGAIPSEMKRVAAEFGKAVLREVPESEFYAALPSLRGKVTDRALLRAIHFYGEETRVQRQISALRRGDEETYRTLMQASGASSANCLQNIYPANGSPERSVSLALALARRALSGRGACRVHGGGFAGTIQCMVHRSAEESFVFQMERAFGKDCCHALSVRPVGGHVLIMP